MTDSAPGDVATFLAGRYGARAGRPVLLGAGEWSAAYALRLDGEPVVARFGGHRQDFAKDEIMGRLAAGRLPVPRVTEILDAPGGFVAVAKQMDGVPLDDLDGPALRAVLPDLLNTLDGIRDLPVDGTGGFGLWADDRRAPHASWAAALLDVATERPRTAGWRDALAASPIGMGTFEAGLTRLADLAPRLPDERHIVHADLLNRNVLVRGDRVTALLDWGNALYGDHLYDAAWLIHWWPWYPAWQAIDIRAELADHWRAHGGAPADVEVRLRAYQLHIALDSMAYCAFRGRWDDAADAARCVRRLLAEG